MLCYKYSICFPTHFTVFIAGDKRWAQITWSNDADTYPVSFPEKADQQSLSFSVEDTTSSCRARQGSNSGM
jgi:hypothetical protein